MIVGDSGGRVLLKSVLSRLVENIGELEKIGLIEPDRVQLKNAVLDRIGCGLAATRIGIGSEYILLGIENPGSSTIWGTSVKTGAEYAALINGATSSHIEADTHDSMIPAAIALGEMQQIDGEKLLMSLKIGYHVSAFVKTLFASELEQKGLHWPAYIGAFSATAACSYILGLTNSEMKNALGINASLCPVSPFEAFTRGAGVKDLYGGWGDMLGVISTRLAKNGLTGPDTVFEGERGLFRTWLGATPDDKVVEQALNLDEPISFHFKPYPCCTAAIPALTALEEILSNIPGLVIDDIEEINIDTYQFGYDLSQGSDPGTSIGAKISIPFLAASMITHKGLLPDHTEKPWIDDTWIRQLSDRVRLSNSRGIEGYSSRTRYADVSIRLKSGVVLSGYTEKPKWSGVNVTGSMIEEKFNANVGGLLPDHQKESIIQTVNSLENLKDIEKLTALLAIKYR